MESRCGSNEYRITLLGALTLACGGQASLTTSDAQSDASSSDTSTASGGNGGLPSDGVAGMNTGTGGALTDTCLGLDTAATGAEPLIDNLEDGDQFIVSADSRTGFWAVNADNECVITPDPNEPMLPTAPGTGNDSTYAMRLTGSGCQTVSNGWGFQAAITLNVPTDRACAYDASVYDGIQFRAIGEGIRLHVMVGLRTTMPMEYGGDGTCDNFTGTHQGCWDFFGEDITLTNEWTVYNLPWTALRQQGWGTRVPWDATQTNELLFQVDGLQTTDKVAEFWLDDVAFYAGNP